jgi:hypothetical protein
MGSSLPKQSVATRWLGSDPGEAPGAVTVQDARTANGLPDHPASDLADVEQRPALHRTTALAKFVAALARASARHAIKEQTHIGGGEAGADDNV